MGHKLRMNTVIRQAMPHDIVLSSGFLAFARHVGVLAAIEEAGVTVSGVCGTSSGALVGALWASGIRGADLAGRLSAQTPLSMMCTHARIWRGLFTMDAVIDQLADWLPPRIEDLPLPFGVGVMAPDGTAQVITAGPLPEAVAASCAIPYIFAPVDVDGISYRDGGVVDRTGLSVWRAARGPQPTWLHLVDRTGGAHTDMAAIPEDVQCIQTPSSGARFWNLGDFAAQVSEARSIAEGVLTRV
jgi:predicted acylesterase/phospholipase RssA